MKKAMRIVVVFGLMLSMLAPAALAQSVLGTTVKKKYSLKNVKCELCHVKTENKDEHPLNDLGKDLAKLVEGKNITKRLDAVKDSDDDTKQKLNDEIGKEFMEVIKKLDEMKAPNGKTYAEAIRAGELEGAVPRK